MGIGAIFGAVNTMYTAVAAARARSRRCARSGSAASRSCSRCCPSRSLLSVVGGLIGGLAAWVAFDGYQTSTMNFQSFSQVAFAFAVTPQLLVMALVYSLLMGLVGGCCRPIRAARLPIVTALREL